MFRRSRGFDLPAGQTVRIDFVMVAAPDSVLLKGVADRAKTLYTNKFIASRPPDPAVIHAAAGNHKVTLKWDDTAEKSIDPASGIQDFKGYKVFRSTDRGNTWGSLKINSDYSVGPDYVPLKIYLSDDFGRISHTFTEANLVNGQEYWYAVVAFDSSGQELDYHLRDVPITAPISCVSFRAAILSDTSRRREASSTPTPEPGKRPSIPSACIPWMRAPSRAMTIK